MSASLVGSEMCIRDSRGLPHPPGGGGRGRGALVLLRRCGRQPAGGALRGPVSYTHLRAHETSAHL
eukprot:10565130-Alexandrium_andersonii.AAC.1